jgi:flagellar hook-associated protein 1 FlgK
MGLNSSLQIGRSALTASQLALQVTGNNLANIATPGYSRQLATLAPIREAGMGNILVGRGVTVLDVRRQIDFALQTRLWASISEQAGGSTELDLLSQVEATLNELSDSDLSSELSAFFNAWSELANSPATPGTRSLIIQKGQALAAYIRRLRADLAEQRTHIDRQIDLNVSRADELVASIAQLNAEIVQIEGTGGMASALRDQRDSLISELSQYVDVSTIEQSTGAVDVYIGSTPVVLGGTSRGLRVQRESGPNGVVVRLRLRESPQDVDVSSGRIGALLSQRGTLVDDTLERLDRVAANLIFEVNRIHSAGYGTAALTSTVGTRTVAGADVNRALNDPANGTFAGLPFRAVNGGFLVSVRDATTGSTQTVRIEVDLDGIDNSGNPGYGDDSSVASIAAALNAIPNLSATVNPDGTISINAASGYEFSFSEDTSGVLAVLGINTFFTGESASTIGVRDQLASNPALLSAGALVDGTPDDNAAALAIAALRDRPVAGLGGMSISGSWQDAVQTIGIRVGSARTRYEATTIVRENLEAQRASISGVNVDEESINMLTYQRQYEGAARFITVVDEMTRTLLSLI